MSVPDSGASQSRRSFATLVLLAVLLLGTYGAVAILSFRFGPAASPANRPILAVLGLLAFAFAYYLAALVVALRMKTGTALVITILLFGLLFRLTSLVSWPILEIDIYRYIWDGSAVAAGVNPYRYSPAQVKQLPWPTSDSQLPDELRRLAELRDDDPSLDTVLSRIHYAELPTIYPPVSQAAFAFATLLTPKGASVFGYILVMKFILVLFDFATLAVIIGLLRLTKLHAGWAIAYGWCPLIIKETANTGHLDSIAVFLATWAVYSAVKPLVMGRWKRFSCTQTLLTGLLLALSIGAKLYPIVLAPWFTLIWFRTHGWRCAASATTVSMGLAFLLVWPMLPSRKAADPEAIQPVATDTLPYPPVPTTTLDAQAIEPQDPSAGLKTFLRHWEMNDFVFLIIFENLKPRSETAPDQDAWFSVLPETWRVSIQAAASRLPGLEPASAPFLVTRLLTMFVYLAIIAGILWPVHRRPEPTAWLRAAFLILAWFWLLSPTQNPWYWTWALPLVMFARSRAWLALSGLVLLYYLRFWLVYHWPTEPVLGTQYDGELFFFFVLTWIEFCPWFIWLTVETIRHRSQHCPDLPNDRDSI